MSGTATNGVDYSIPVSVTIPGGSTSATVTVTPIDDTTPEPTETVTLTLTANPTAYNLTTASSATINLLDNEPIVSVSAASNAAEPSTNGQFVFSRTGTLTNPLTVNVSVSGTASRALGGRRQRLSDLAHLGDLQRRCRLGQRAGERLR